MASTFRPGVEIQQVIRENPTIPNPPALVPVMVGPCYQIINILNNDGSLNGTAKSSTGYAQAAVSFTQSQVPDAGRDNLDEIDILEDKVSVSLQYGNLINLDRGSHSSTGSAFLGKFPEGRRAAIVFPGIESFTDSGNGSLSAGPRTASNNYMFDSNAENTSFILLVSLDQGTAITVEFNKYEYTAAELAEVFTSYSIPAAVVTINSEEFCVIHSNRYGSRSSIKLSGGAGALEYLFGNSSAMGTNNASDFEVYGSGISTLDDEDGDTLTPYFTYSVGKITLAGVSNVGAPHTDARAAFNEASVAGHVTGSPASKFVSGLESSKTFAGGSADIPLKACSQTSPGDIIISGGSQLLDAEVYTVDEDRFTLAILDTENSTYDAATGDLVKRKYRPIETNVYNQFKTTGRYAYAIAQNLTQGSSVGSTAAEIEGTGVPTVDEDYAIVLADNSISGTLALAGKTLTLKVTIDGVEGSVQVIQFAGALTPSEAAAYIQANASGVSASFTSNYIVIKTLKKGADQKISLTMTESTTAGYLLGFDESQTKSGIDFGFGDLAVLEGLNISLPLPDLSAVDLELSDGVYSVSQTVDFSSAATLADAIGALESAFGGSSGVLYRNGQPFLVVEADDETAATGQLIFKSIKGGSAGSVEIINADEENVRALGFADSTGSFREASIVVTDASVAGATVNGTALTLEINGDPGQTVIFTATQEETTRAGLVTQLNSLVETGTNAANFVFIDSEDDTVGIIVRCITNSVSSFAIASSGMAALTGFTQGTDSNVSGASDSASGAAVLVGEVLTFYLDDNPTPYAITLASDSVSDIVELINSEESGVGGSIPIASASSTGTITLTSSFIGLSSKVLVKAGTAANVLGLATSTVDGSASGSGRPEPDFYIDLSGVLHIGANILRDGISGTPAARKDVTGAANIYIGYKALRKDVSSSAADASVLSFSDAAQLDAVLGPINTENPLAMAAFLALANSPTVDVSVLGIDEVSSGAPMGTVTAYSKALSYLESQDVYCLVPLTDSLFVCQLFSVHVQAMSQPSERSERICFLWQPIPSRDTDTSIQSGTAGETNGVDNEFIIESTPISGLVAAGISDTELEANDNVYIEVVLIAAGESNVRNYSIKEVDGPRLVLRTSFSSGENDDGFYSETDLSGEYTDVTYSLRVRGDKLVLTGTNIPDRAAQASAAGSLAGQFASRRVYLTAFNSVDTIVNGISFNVPGYYASAAIAGMIAQQAPQQPFTNLAIAGFTKVYGTDDTFTENQLDIIADGGRYLLVNQNGAIASRHQRSTATLSIESRELSITKAIDFIAKGLRNINKNYIGRFVITPGFLDQLTMVNQGFLLSQEQAGTVTSATLNAVLQDEDAPDTVLIEIQVQPAYPCNKINITILS